MKIKVNKNGDTRGVTPEAQAALVKARENRRMAGNNFGKPKSRPGAADASTLAPALQFSKLLRGDPTQLHERIRKFVTLVEQEPGALTATVIGTLMADLDEANTALKKAWAYVNHHLDENGDPREIAKLLEELRKWTETLQEAALRAAEIQAKGLSQTKAVDPLDAYRVEEPQEDAPPARPCVEVNEPPDDPDIVDQQ